MINDGDLFLFYAPFICLMIPSKFSSIGMSLLLIGSWFVEFKVGGGSFSDWCAFNEVSNNIILAPCSSLYGKLFSGT